MKVGDLNPHRPSMKTCKMFAWFCFDLFKGLSAVRTGLPCFPSYMMVWHTAAPLVGRCSNLVSVISWSKWENGGFNGFSIVVIAYPLTPPAPIQVDK